MLIDCCSSRTGLSHSATVNLSFLKPRDPSRIPRNLIAIRARERETAGNTSSPVPRMQCKSLDATDWTRVRLRGDLWTARFRFPVGARKPIWIRVGRIGSSSRPTLDADNSYVAEHRTGIRTHITRTHVYACTHTQVVWARTIRRALGCRP